MDLTTRRVLRTISLDEVNRETFARCAARHQTGVDVEPQLSSQDYELIASYNWLTPAEDARRRSSGFNYGHPISSKPTIVVPGAPKRFVAWKGGLLNQDTEPPFADENRFFMNDYPLEPMIRAVLCEGFDPLAFQTLDVVTDRNNLRRLFDFSKHRSDYFNPRTGRCNKPNPFRMNLERAGPELVLMELVRPIEHDRKPSPIYGHDFEDRCGVPFSPLTKGSYYGIVKYKLGDLSCLVRVPADCAEYPDLNAGGSGEKVSEEDVTPKRFPDSQLSFIRHGYRSRDYKFVELTTRHTAGKFYPFYIWDQLYFGRANTVYIGWHKDGQCQFPQLLSLAELHEGGRMQSKQHTERTLRNTFTLLKMIVEFVRSRPAGERYCVVYDDTCKTDALEVRLRSDNEDNFEKTGLLPPKLKRLLINGDEEEEDEDKAQNVQQK